ncbi:hypothetical protein [Metabacillus litoralis]|uniref:hypothetical protein n=1 Tax=Metabacillus litoralis TaxID=152268 RepID=UPI001CFD7E75|nr:hypothetical protein [Metabacillus litoralis]
MIYYMFKEKERLELESILLDELKSINDILESGRIKEQENSLKERALKERTKILMSLLSKLK